MAIDVILLRHIGENMDKDPSIYHEQSRTAFVNHFIPLQYHPCRNLVKLQSHFANQRRAIAKFVGAEE
jgi:hypothetical protein